MYQCFCVEKHGEFRQCINYFILRCTYLFCHALHVFMRHYPSTILKTRGEYSNGQKLLIAISSDELDVSVAVGVACLTGLTTV